MNLIDYAVIGVYLVLGLPLTYWIGRKQKNTEDYFLAGRRMSWWPVAIALFASLSSPISYISILGEAYRYDCTMLLLGVVKVISLPLMLFVFLRFFYRMKPWTFNEYLEHRFSVSVRLICAGMFLVARCFYLCIMLYAAAMLLAGSFGISPAACILMIGFVATLYAFFGGMKAVIWTDVMLFVVLIGGILLAIGVVAWKIPGGIGGIWNIAAEHHHTFNLGSGFWGVGMAQRLTFWYLLLELFFSLFFPVADQVNLQRCMTCRDFRGVTRAVSLSTLSSWPICFLFYFAGLAVFAYCRVLDPALAEGLDGEEAVFRFFSSGLPVGVRGVLMVALLAAVMSTICAVEHSIATVWIKDVYQRLLSPDREDLHYMKVARRSILLLGAFICLFGVIVLQVFKGRPILLFELSNVLLWILGTFLGMIFALGLLTRRANSTGLIVGMIAGVPVAFYFYIFQYLLTPSEERMSFFLIAFFPMATILLVGYFWSLASGGESPGSGKYVIWNRWFPHNE